MELSDLRFMFYILEPAMPVLFVIWSILLFLVSFSILNLLMENFYKTFGANLSEKPKRKPLEDEFYDEKPKRYFEIGDDGELVEWVNTHEE